MSDLSDLRDLAPRPQPVTGPIERQRPKEPKPRKQLPKRNERRARARFAKQFGACARMARFGACAVPSCKLRWPDATLQAAHVRTRGAGGLDWCNVVGLCADHHHEQGRIGILTFQERHGVDLEVAAVLVARRVLAHHCSDFRELHRGSERCAVCHNEPPEAA